MIELIRSFLGTDMAIISLKNVTLGNRLWVPEMNQTYMMWKM